ncbi:DNA photolyase [Octadecabacter sp. G9-8]|uniref:DNA photolyase n=2 Tax=Octadecabacter dasysiphoniae TaxID=2909341 RepID=A0ABS9CSR3_9RHOB|nr:FAD-binding domain-containing protein [Octadecabacter dasysiphoniae]MCF2870275.1 DNA photolyase [Octadecabacter dasysiphoniae]
MFTPTRTAALDRLAQFAPKAGRDYASKRNYDRPGHDDVSRLSPYLRHRMITEDDVLKAVLARHSPAAAEKFIQEVYWRTYWKGWLEQRPSAWSNYRVGLNAAMNHVQTGAGLRREWEAACGGDTGIACFDAWAQELVQTGYLHNHARMWFASIWIFTLRLPWELGADFFMRHLLDGDAASNTLGWRWVAGLQTIGKTYLARPDNIAKYTDGRFKPTGLATFAAPLDGPPPPERTAPPISGAVPSGKVGLLITEDDLSPEWMFDQITPAAQSAFNGVAHRSPLRTAPIVDQFVESAMDDLEQRIGPLTRHASPTQIDDWAAQHCLDAIVMSYAPVGGTADALGSLKTPLVQLVRPYDEAAWPHASAGFFKFKSKIPKLLTRYDAQLSLL